MDASGEVRAPHGQDCLRSSLIPAIVLPADFMLLRSLLGHVPESLVQWWDAFALADEETRAGMITRGSARGPHDGGPPAAIDAARKSADGETPAEDGERRFVEKASPFAATRSSRSRQERRDA